MSGTWRSNFNKLLYRSRTKNLANRLHTTVQEDLQSTRDVKAAAEVGQRVVGLGPMRPHLT